MIVETPKYNATNEQANAETIVANQTEAKSHFNSKQESKRPRPRSDTEKNHCRTISIQRESGPSIHPSIRASIDDQTHADLYFCTFFFSPRKRKGLTTTTYLNSNNKPTRSKARHNTRPHRPPATALSCTPSAAAAAHSTWAAEDRSSRHRKEAAGVKRAAVTMGQAHIADSRRGGGQVGWQGGWRSRRTLRRDGGRCWGRRRRVGRKEEDRVVAAKLFLGHEGAGLLASWFVVWIVLLLDRFGLEEWVDGRVWRCICMYVGGGKGRDGEGEDDKEEDAHNLCPYCLSLPYPRCRRRRVSSFFPAFFYALSSDESVQIQLSFKRSHWLVSAV